MHQDIDSASSASSVEGKTSREGEQGDEMEGGVEADGEEQGGSPGQIKKKGRTAKIVKVSPRNLCSSSSVRPLLSSSCLIYLHAHPTDLPPTPYTLPLHISLCTLHSYPLHPALSTANPCGRG